MTTKSKLIFFALISFACCDLAYSFFQYLGQPLDGDIAWNIADSKEITQIINDPFALKALINHESYLNPNRFFCHWIMKNYMNYVPKVLKHFVSPIQSIYLSIAIIKSLLHFSLIFILSKMVSRKVYSIDFATSICILTVLFQANGYHDYMGIILASVTYTFFYTLPTLLLIIYFLPLYFVKLKRLSSNKTKLTLLFWLIFCVPVSLSGPLNPGISLILILIIIIKLIIRNMYSSSEVLLKKKLRKSISDVPIIFWFCFVPLVISSLYSLHIGKYNYHNLSVPLSFVYSSLLIGIKSQLTVKLGFPLLLGVVILNGILIQFVKPLKNLKIRNNYITVFTFIFLYILLLPLGGYREYRPEVIRHDTLIPVTLSLMYLLIIGIVYLLNTANRRYKKLIISSCIVICIIYSNSDLPEFTKNECERNTLRDLQQSNSRSIKNNYGCSLMSWDKKTNPSLTKHQVDQLIKWGILK